MKKFAELYFALDGSTKTNDKVAALRDYLRDAPPADAAWAVFFLRGGKLRAPVPARVLAEMAAESARVPHWLFEECYETVGDLAETAALLIADTEAAGEQAGHQDEGDHHRGRAGAPAGD